MISDLLTKEINTSLEEIERFIVKHDYQLEDSWDDTYDNRTEVWFEFKRKNFDGLSLQLRCIISHKNENIEYRIKHYTNNYDKPFAKGYSKDFTKAWNIAKKEYNKFIKKIDLTLR